MKTSQHAKLNSSAPGHSHTKSKLSRLDWHPPSPLGFKDPEVENEAEPTGCGDHYQATPPSLCHISTLCLEISQQCSSTQCMGFLGICVPAPVLHREDERPMHRRSAFSDRLIDEEGKESNMLILLLSQALFLFIYLVNKNTNQTKCTKT